MSTFNEQSKIRGALRQVARYMPQKQECLLCAIHPTEKGIRGGKLYICNKCGLTFPLKEIDVDHIEPVVPVDRPIKDWNEYIERLFCDSTNLQVLCKRCHLAKYAEEAHNRI